MIPERYTTRRSTLLFDEVSYGVGGIELATVAKLPEAQQGYSVNTDGHPLADTELGSWSADWVVIGHEMACGDPIFLSLTAPHPVYTAMSEEKEEEGEWVPNLIAPTVDKFWDCLERFRRFAIEKSPGDHQIGAYLTGILRFCDGIPETVEFWAIQAEIGMEDERWRLRLEEFLDTGKLD